MTPLRDVHVYRDPRRDGWKVRQSGRTISRHRTQLVAARAGARLARRTRVDLVTHGYDGRVKSAEHYGYDRLLIESAY